MRRKECIFERIYLEHEVGVLLHVEEFEKRENGQVQILLRVSLEHVDVGEKAHGELMAETGHEIVVANLL